MVQGPRARPSSRRLIRAVLMAYALVVGLLPLSHHDVACYLKSSTHCASCLVSGSAESASHAAALEAVHLTDAGNATSDPAVSVSSVPLGTCSGRSPPALG
jgi:hypothetical protein